MAGLRFAREGIFLAVVPGFMTGLVVLLGSEAAGAVGVVVTLGVLLFFRDPGRTIEAAEGEVLSPADGRIVAVERTTAPGMADGGMRISVFMSVFNVHINRVPVSGRVISVRHIPGGFAMANLEEASLNNERTEVMLEDHRGRRVLMVQIAGLVARRIVCRLNEGDEVKAGQKFGLICFGSRVDLYLPPDAGDPAGVGDKVKAGVDTLAWIR